MTRSDIVVWTTVAFLGLLVAVQGQYGKPKPIRIGGLFEVENRQQQHAFLYAIDKVNRNPNILPGVVLKAEVLPVAKHDSFNASKQACSVLNIGVAGLVGPLSKEPSSHVRSICHYLDVPQIQVRWTSQNNLGFYAVNLYPDHDMLSQAFIALVNLFKWDRFTLIYQTDDGLIRLQKLLDKDNTNAIVTVYQLPLDGNYQDMLNKIRNAKNNRIVVDCETDMIKPFLRQAKEMDMVTNAYHYLFTTLDLGVVSFRDFKMEGANITAYRLVDPDSADVTRIVTDWTFEERASSIFILKGEKGLTTESALIFDGVELLARALHNASNMLNIAPKRLLCNGTGPSASWAQGATIINSIRSASFEGLTGPVSMDGRTGKRSDFKLELEEVQPLGHSKMIGEWTPKRSLRLSKTFKDTLKNALATMKNITLRVVTKDDSPFVFYNETNEEGKELKGNDRFRGFCIDLLKGIKAICELEGWGRLNFIIHRVKDGNYGAAVNADVDPRESPWNGMVGELIRGEADLAMASLTITYVREQVIDFSKPFWNLGISIIYKRSQESTPELFTFLSPLSITVWMYMIGAYLLISFMLFVLARFSPYEWTNAQTCGSDSEELENQFGLMNSMWFTIGSLMQQGSDLAPQATSTRMLAGFWWFFTLIMISSYTANLAAFLTVERMAIPIENAEDLANQKTIKYGTLKSGSTLAFFKRSQLATYKKMWNFMSLHKDEVFVNTTADGIAKVEKENYAFLLESTQNEYFVQRKCDLMQIGGYLDSKGYGVGLPQNSIYRDMISDAVLKLQEQQKIQRMYDRWWKEEGAGNCGAGPGGGTANELGVANVGGVFVVLIGGMFLSMLVALVEFIWKARKQANKDQEPLCTEMWNELKFALNCVGSSKRPVHRHRNEKNTREDIGLDEPYSGIQVPLNGMSYSTQQLAKHKRTLEREIYA